MDFDEAVCVLRKAGLRTDSHEGQVPSYVSLRIRNTCPCKDGERFRNYFAHPGRDGIEEIALAIETISQSEGEGG